MQIDMIFQKYYSYHVSIFLIYINIFKSIIYIYVFTDLIFKNFLKISYYNIINT